MDSEFQSGLSGACVRGSRHVGWADASLLQSKMRQSTVAEPALWLEDPETRVESLSMSALETFEGLEVDQAWVVFVASPNFVAEDRSF